MLATVMIPNIESRSVEPRHATYVIDTVAQIEGADLHSVYRGGIC